MPVEKSKIYYSVLWLGLLIFGGLAAFGWYSYKEVKAELELEQSLTNTLEGQIADLELELEQSLAEADELETELAAEKNKNDEFEDQIAGITDVVGDLKKLSETDPELLKKYSKVYFLSENYAPVGLESIPEQYLYDKSRELSVQVEVSSYLEDLLEEATEDGVDLKVVSAYRSFGEQSSLKSQYLVNYGTGANTFSADQGYSEHQLGTTVDFTTAEISATFAGFEKTEAYEWLLDNAHKYGFVLSYPDNNQYYEFEPWHWRFVGRRLARHLHNEGKHFYNLDQREIDQYLIDLFD